MTSNGLPPSLCNMPEEVVWLILGCLDFGDLDNKQDIWAVSGTCKTLRQLLARFPAKLCYSGQWNKAQLAGVCKSLPGMVSWEPARDSLGEAIYTAGGPIHVEELHLQPYVACPCLRKLDLGTFWHPLSDRDAPDGGHVNEDGMHEWRPEEGPGVAGQLPQGLTELRMFGRLLPEALMEQIEGLPKLTHLACRRTEFYPSGNLSNLEHLEVGGRLISCPCHDPFYEFELSSLKCLTSLHLELPMLLSPAMFDYPAAGRLQHLTVVVSYQQVSWEPTLALLAPLSGLRKLDLRWCSPTTAPYPEELQPLPSAGNLRELSIAGAPASFQGIQASKLTSLTYAPHYVPDRYDEDKELVLSRLSAADIAAIAGLSSLKKLALPEFEDWDDLAPLRGLPLETFECCNVCLLDDMVAPGALGTLKEVELPDLGSNWLVRGGEDVSRKITRAAKLLARVADGLLALPRLETLVSRRPAGPDACVCASEGRMSEIVDLHPAQWQRFGSKRHVMYRRVRG